MLYKLKEWLDSKIADVEKQRKLVLATVCIALLLDYMLYMVIVPIIPEYLDSMGYLWRTRKDEKIWKNVNVTYVPTQVTLPTLPNGAKQTHPPHHLPSNRTLTKTMRVQNGTRWLWLHNKASEDRAIGYLFASKAIVQIVINPIAGTIIDRIGYDRPMMFGISVLFISTLIFALGDTYGVLLMARGMQGLGSAFADPAAFAMIADRFTEEHARSRALGIALSCVSFGYLAAPPFGGILYQMAGKGFPFVTLALFALADGVLMMIVMQPVREERNQKVIAEELPQATPIWKLIMDPYIAVCAGALVVGNSTLAFLEPTIAMWMKDEMHAKEWQMGFVWFPPFFPYLFGIYFTISLAKRIPKYQWAIPMAGLVICGLSCLIIPASGKSFIVLVIPLSFLCFGVAMIDTSILPTMGYLVDTRHVPIYGSAYAITDFSYSFGSAIGPILAGEIVASVGFTWLNIIIFICTIAYAPMLFFLWRIYKYRPMEVNPNENVVLGDPPNPEYKTYLTNAGPDGAVEVDGVPGTNHLQYGQDKDRWDGVKGFTTEHQVMNQRKFNDSDEEYGY